MEKILDKTEQPNEKDFKDLLDEVAKFRQANQKFLKSDIDNYKSVNKYRIK